MHHLPLPVLKNFAKLTNSVTMDASLLFRCLVHNCLGLAFRVVVMGIYRTDRLPGIRKREGNIATGNQYLLVIRRLIIRYDKLHIPRLSQTMAAEVSLRLG